MCLHQACALIQVALKYCKNLNEIVNPRFKDPLQSFYKARAGYFYGAEVDSVNFLDIEDQVRQ